MSSQKFTQEEIDFIVALRATGAEWTNVQTEYKKKFNLDKSTEALRHVYRRFHGTSGVPKVEAPVKKPHPFADFTKEALGSIVKVNDYNTGVFFVTAASPTSHINEQGEIEDDFFIGANVHKKGFSAVNNFCKRKDAQLIIMPMRAHVKALKDQPNHYDPILREHADTFATEFTFNRHLKAIEAELNPQQINPITGLKRLKGKPGTLFSGAEVGNKINTEIKRFKTSLIIAHSKQMMEVIATGNNTHPRIIHSTGCITEPAYLRNRIGMIAEEDHVLGGLIVEIKDGVFHIRQAQIDPSDGSFVDVGTRYHADGSIEFERAEAFKMGDIHPGLHDSKVLDCWYEIWDIVKPKRIFYEDFFDGKSISHHLMKKNLTRQKLEPWFKTLKDELEMARKVLYSTIERAPKDAEILATASNHPDHVFRYLEEGRYINDDVNFDIAHRMVVDDLDGNNPLKRYLDPESKMRWLHENDDYFVEGVQFAAHGHLGVNGTRGGRAGFETNYGKAMLAHSHTPGIFHQVFQVGHSSKARHGYNNGPSTWIPCSGTVYKRGQMQLHMVIGGEWTIAKPKKLKKIKKK